MIDRRQILIGAAVSLLAARITPWPASRQAPGLYATHWSPTRRFAVGDRVGYVVDSFLDRRMLFFTAAVTKVRQERGGWIVNLQSSDPPDVLRRRGGAVHSDDYDFEESWRHLWHLIKLPALR